MIYISRNESNEIYTYGETPDAAAASVEEYAGTMSDYAARCALSVDKSTIKPDGLDEAIVTISTSLSVASIDLDVDGTTETVAIAGGVGTLVISADAPGVIAVQPADLTTYPAAGVGTVTIIAEEAE